MKRSHKPLSVKVTRDGVLTIEIGINALAFAALRSPFAYEMMGPEQERPDTRFRISNTRGFAVEVKRELLDELGEDGSTLLTNVIDEACQKAIEDGSQFWMRKDEEP